MFRQISTMITFREKNPNSRSVLRLFIRPLSRKSNDQTLTVSYLINTCGLSPRAALSVSEKVSFESTERPDSVIGFLNLQGFSKTHISKFVARWPKCLLANPEKTLLPKFDFFISKGFSRPQLVECISAFPFIMRRSLENVIAPNFQYVKNFLRTDERTLVAMRRDMWIIAHNAHYLLAPNIRILRNNGVPESKIAYLLHVSPRAFRNSPEKLEKLVGEVKKMGLNPAKSVFVVAINVKSMKKSTWERKVNAYKRWGWTEDVILEAFRKQPLCMKISESNIMESMDFLVNQLGLDSLSIAKRVDYLMYNLKKKIIPRAAVVKFLLLKGLIKENVSYLHIIKLPERKFLEKFVNLHNEAPQLLKLYNEKMTNSLTYHSLIRYPRRHHLQKQTQMASPSMGNEEDYRDGVEENVLEEEDEEEVEDGGEEEEDEDDHNFRFQCGMNPFDFLENDSCGFQPYEQFQRIEYEALAEKKRKLLSSRLTAEKESMKRVKLGDSPGATMEEIMEAMNYGSRRKPRKLKQRGRRKGSRKRQNPEITRMLGDANLLYASGDYEEAIPILNEVVRKAPNFPDSYHTLGLVYDALGNGKKAMDFYMIAAHLTSKDPSLWKLLFTWSLGHGNIPQARYCLCKAITADPKDVSLRAQLASLYLQIKDYRKAAESYIHIQKICPERADALTTAAKLYLRCGQHDHAVRILLEYIENQQSEADWSAIELSSAIYMERSSYDKALRLIQSAELKKELPRNLMVRAGICHLHLADPRKAETIFKVLRGSTADGCADLIFQVADSYMSLEHFDSALEYYQMLEGYPEANGLLHMKLAQCYMALKRRVEAITYFYKGLNVLNNNVGARLALASLLLEENKEDEAISVLSPPEDSDLRGVDMEGTVPWWIHGKVRMKLANIYRTKGMTDQFVDIMTPLLRKAIDVERHQKEVRPKRRLSRTVLFERAKILDDQYHDNIFHGFRPFASSSDLLKAGRAKRLLEKRKILQGGKAVSMASGVGCYTDSSDEEQQEYVQPERNEALLHILWEDEELQALILDLCRALVSLQRYLEASDIINGTLKLASEKLSPEKKHDLESLAARIAYITTDPKRGFEWVRELLQKDHYGLFAWNCFYKVISRLEISYTKHSKLLRNVRSDNKCCVPPIVITGHQFTSSNHYQDAAREYLEASKLLPDNPLINLCAGTSLINLALGFRLKSKQHCLVQGLAFLFRNLLLCKENQEAIFNVARAFHQVGLLSHAASYYEKVLASSEKDYDIPRLPHDSSPMENPKSGYCDLRREAAYNLHLMYKRSGAYDLARQVLKDHCTF